MKILTNFICFLKTHSMKMHLKCSGIIKNKTNSMQYKSSKKQKKTREIKYTKIGFVIKTILINKTNLRERGNS